MTEAGRRAPAERRLQVLAAKARADVVGREPHYRGWVKAPAVRSPHIRWAVICIVVLVLAVDQVSKALAVAAAPSGSRGGLVWGGPTRNTGASFGIGTWHPVLITVAAAAVLAAAVIWLARTRRPGAALCLAVVVGGAAGTSLTGCCGHRGRAGGRQWTGFTSLVTLRRSISRTWPSAPEPSARSW